MNNCPDCNKKLALLHDDPRKSICVACGKMFPTETSRSKYRNTRTEYNGMKFDSKLEADFCKRLDLLKEGPLKESFKYYLRQVPFHLPGGIIYRVDFMEVYAYGKLEIIRYTDVKGFETKEFKMKKKQVKALYGVTINIVTKKDLYITIKKDSKC